METERLDRFATLLSQLSPDVWEAAVCQAPSYQKLKQYSQAWPFGPLGATYVMLGLNNYQTTGKADVGYWPKVLPLLCEEMAPRSPNDLRELLFPFYCNERFSTNKVKRLDGFTSSRLCQYIWDSDAASIAAEFPEIWPRLAGTMNQNQVAKTIVFAMKCLSHALIMVGETRFDFGKIPVPVDSRLRGLSRQLGLPDVGDDRERDRWREVLERIHRTNDYPTIVHLDSILWQIGTSPRGELIVHLRNLGSCDEIAKSIGDVVHP